MIDILALLAADPNIDPALRSILSRTPIATRGSGRWCEVMDEEYEDQQRDHQRSAKDE